MGTIFQRNGKLYVRYYDPSKRYTVKESAHTTKLQKAERLLRDREGSKDRGEKIIKATNFTMNELFDLVIVDYQNQDRRDTERTKQRIENHLKPFFQNRRAGEIGYSEIEEYKLSRKKEGARGSTINRELAHLSLGFELAVKARKVPYRPIIDRFSEKGNEREGFFTVDEFLKFQAELPAHLKPVAEFGYTIGWRSAAITNLKWDQVNRVAETITLTAANSKNRKPYTIHYAQNTDIKSMIETQWARKTEIENRTGKSVDYVFFFLSGRKSGNRIKSFDGAWEIACENSEMSKLFHDLRRSAVRNMVNAGIPQKTAMEIAGFETPVTFQRYAKASERDKEIAASKIGLSRQIESNFESNDQKSEAQAAN